MGEVKEIQQHLSAKRGLDNMITTKRSDRFCNRAGVVREVIYRNVRRVANLEIRQFLWLYFQGGLPFYHKGSCFACTEPLSHKHIFFTCPHAKEVWEAGNRAIELLINLRPKKKPSCRVNPNPEEALVWALWSEDHPKPPILREIIAAVMYTIWKTRPLPEEYKRKRRVTLSGVLNEILNDNITIARLIKIKDERNEAILRLAKQWNCLSGPWHNEQHYYELRTESIYFIECSEEFPHSEATTLLLNKLRTKCNSTLNISDAFAGGKEFIRVK